MAPKTDSGFTWDAIPDSPEKLPFVLLVEGQQGSGKTHIGYTFPKPIFHLDTENRGDKVAAKFVAQKAEAYRKVCNDFSDVRRTLLELVFPHFKSGTVLLDSGSDLLSYAEREWLAEAKKDKVYPLVLWAKVNAKVDGMVATVRDHGFYLVITARLKPEYKGEEKTGAFVMEGYKRLPYLADVHIRIEHGQAAVLKNGFRNTAEERAEPLARPSFKAIVDELVAAESDKALAWDAAPADSARNVPREGYLRPSPPEGYIEPPPANGHESTDDQVKAALGFPADPEPAEPTTPEQDARNRITKLVTAKGKTIDSDDFKRWFKAAQNVEWDKANLDSLLDAETKLAPKKAS